MAKTHEQFVKELFRINPGIKVIGQYTKSTERVKVECIKCGKIWTPLAYSLSSGKSCPHCSAIKGAKNNTGITSTKTKDQFCEELKQVDPSIEVIGEYTNNKDIIECHCRRCNNNWKVRPYSLLQGHGCPRCAKSGTSFMEQFILLSFKEALGDKSVISRDKSLIRMELDIYIPEKNIAIEPGNWLLHKRSLGRDEQKRELCAKKQVKLITIYDKYPKNQPPPFDDDCIVFDEDYNKADHAHIRQLVENLFLIAQVSYSFTNADWDEIENKAYNLAKSKTHNAFVNELNEVNPSIQVLGEYKNTNIRLLARCMNCGYEWNAVPASLLSGDGCRKCGTKTAHAGLMKSQMDFVSEINQVNPNVEIIGIYNGRHVPIKTRCRICGYEWEPRASSLLRGSSHKGASKLHKRASE